MNKRYYISTGAKDCFYTLRYTFTETRYERTEHGVVPAGEVQYDYHVRNLSTDREQAIAKARELGKGELKADFDLNPIVRRDEVDWSVFQAGKFAGKSIHEVAELDRPYLVWVCENLAGSRHYGKTVELVKAVLPALSAELDSRAQDRAQSSLPGESIQIAGRASDENYP